jgi:hypothetical protein
MAKQQGIRHADRLIHVLLEIAENDNLDASTRLDATEQAAVLLGRRKSYKQDKKKAAIQKMLGEKNPKPQT